ncbi:hypothetical protein FQR65_LT13587 [Abscondita terminalis]|nr:hypothetical protein FQR65_LT13587 [Abscondita terminalis]
MTNLFNGMTEAGAECLADTTLTGTIDNEVINKNLHLGDDGISKHLLLDLPELLKEIQNVNGKAHFENDDECVDNNESNKNWQTVYVTGQKNAQLICIRDNSSTPDLVLTQPNPSLATISRESTLEEIIPAYEDGKKLRTVKISRLSKPTLNVLKPLPIVQIKSILQGKLRQAKYIKGNPMYCKTYKTHPWHIIEEIAEHLLNDALLSLVKEIQVQSILESLYISEFQ